MKFALALFGLRPHLLNVLATKADELGYESLWCSDHLMPLTSISPNYPYSPDKLPPFTPDWEWHDPWVLMSSLAGITKNIRFATNVYIAPLRHPFVTARAVATLDVVSGGRVIFGAGVGWWPEEFAAADQDFDNRGPRTTEIVTILRRLWTEETVEHHGKFYDFPEVTLVPKPVQQPIPIIFGGNTKAAHRRAAREGDGWMPAYMGKDEVVAGMASINELRKEYGREHLPFEVTGALMEPPSVDAIRRYEEAGIDRLLVGPYGFPDANTTAEVIEAGLEQFANDIMAKL